VVTKEQLTADMKTAMKAKDQLRLSTIRLVRSAVKNAEIDKGGSLSEEELIGVIAREAKKRREAIALYEQGGRSELAEKESRELDVLQEYLPEQLSEAEIGRLVDEAIADTGAAGPREMGKVMAALMPKVKGKADGALVSAIVKDKLDNLQ
jgi:uncharacterized protein YqeY